MKDPIAGWRAEHADFTRLLDVLEEEVARFEGEQVPDYALMLDVLAYLRHFPEHQHHPREDVAFARLAAHDPALEPLLGRFLQEHRVIAQSGRELEELLEAVLVGGVVPLTQLEGACAQFLVYYRHHIRGEDELVMPLAARLLSADDWQDVGAAVAAAPDPLFGADVDDRYADLRRRIEAEARPAG